MQMRKTNEQLEDSVQNGHFYPVSFVHMLQVWQSTKDYDGTSTFSKHS